MAGLSRLLCGTSHPAISMLERSAPLQNALAGINETALFHLLALDHCLAQYADPISWIARHFTG